MPPSASSSASQLPAASEQEARIKHMPAEARAAFQRFRTGGDVAELDPVIFAILGDFIPLAPAVPLSEQLGTTRLIEELGFDSLSITEVVFFTEDLFGITITNEEIIQVRTLDDLRGFIHRKVAVRAKR